MSDAEWDDAVGLMCQVFDSLVPENTRDRADEILVPQIDLARPLLESLPDEHRARIAVLMVAGFDLARAIPDPLNEKASRIGALLAKWEKLKDSVTALVAGTPAEGPLPRNVFHVTAHDNHVTHYAPTGCRVNPSEAVNLGVWLIAVADPTLSDAVPMLLRVATR